MSRIHNILLIAVMALLSVACQRRPMEEEYLRVYLDLDIERKGVNYEVGEDKPGLMRVVFFDAETKAYLSHDFVSHDGGYIFAPYGDVDIVVYNLESGETRIRSGYSWSSMEAYTDEIAATNRNRFEKYLNSRIDTRPTYESIRVTPEHLFVAREQNIHIPRHTAGEDFIIQTTAKSIVESWTIEINGVTGIEWVGSVSMMLSGQVQTHFVATDIDSTEPVALFFDLAKAQRRSTGTVVTSRFETFGREKTSGDKALLSILFTDVQGHPYMYNFDVSDQMENNPQQHIVINGKIDIPKPSIGSGFDPVVDGWDEFEYNVDI